ncbi:MAG: response regulator transcription factor [Methyloversatilis sp.]|jgi:DNA-binding NarL/FixJ family response regulator|uniref:Response regulator, NarL-family n=1 Tax=Methyloversatilis universalis (strain ATCC BAA-1314 / DSM 25237 / JCM 13912 / CCUG 52030 / FAM5) TaxID=1000565 RepID=F5RET4_METUF|nr:response regulator transcription factor [Methyloversatilis universalis]EGK71415.1 Response regulator, NarL-family [Methyloversatilis universalis FAM5]MCP4638024.1 response regulator transcription factor [Methyloversatilis sp.]
MKTGFILEDLPESQAWLRDALEQSFPGIAIDSAYSLAEAAHKLAAGPAPDIALIDLGLPDGSGITLIEQIQRRSPATLCIVASIYDDDGHIFPALRAGARGYLLKDQPVAGIVQALTGIAAGQPPLSPAIARRMLAFFQPAPSAPGPDLTERETEVLRLISKGLTQAETARLLGISQHTVAGYVKELYRKLNVSSRAEAALIARDLGLV